MESLGGSEESSREVRFALREIIRQEISLERKKQREAVLVGRRNIQEYGFNGEKFKPSDIEALAARLKKKQGGREGCYRDLYSLQAALSYSGKINGEAFVKVDGAIAALVRDVSGNDSSLQLRATYCCANLPLAGPDVGLKVAKAVTPYLINHLRGMNQILLEASLWAVGSLAASGVQAYKVLKVQGIYPRLISIMQQYHLPSGVKCASEEKNKVKLQSHQVMEAALYAAAHCVSAGVQDDPKFPEIEEIAVMSVPLLNGVDSLSLPRLVYLYFLISCSEASDSEFLKEDFLLKMILLLDETLMIQTDVHNDLKAQGFTVEVITFIVRILGNLCSTDLGRSLLENISSIGCPVISHLMKSLVNLPKHVTKETLWFLMQLLKPYTEWVDDVFHICDCPWSPIIDMVKLHIEQQLKINKSNIMDEMSAVPQ